MEVPFNNCFKEVEDDEKEMNALSLLFVDNDLLFKLPELVPLEVVEEEDEEELENARVL